MRTTAIITACALCSIGGAIAAYKIAFPTYTHRYRLTLAVDAGGKRYSGSSVIEVRWIGQPRLGDASPFISSVKGAAPLIELPNGAALLAALHRSPNEFDRGVNADVLAVEAFQLQGFDGYRRIGQQTGRRALSSDNMPLLIWFSNIASLHTAKPITAAHIPELLGSDARLSEAYVEMTDDPVIIDIDRKLPWFAALKDEQRGLIVTRPNEFKMVHNMIVGDDS